MKMISKKNIVQVILPRLFLAMFFLLIINIALVSSAPDEVVWYKGENAFDSASGRYNLTLQAGASIVPSKLGNGINFVKASNQYANTSATNTFLNVTSDFTVTKWFNLTIDCVAGQNCLWEGLGTNTASDYLSNGPISAPPTWLRMTSSSGNNDSMGLNWASFVNRSTFMVLRYNSSNNFIDIYIGNSTGNLTYYPKMSKSADTLTFTANAQQIILGDDITLGIGGVDAVFDDWRLFNTSLTTTEINLLWNNGFGTTSSLSNLSSGVVQSVTINTPVNNSVFFVGNHNYFDVDITATGFGGNVTTQLNIYNNTNDLLYTYFSQSNPFLQNITNLSIGTYKLNASSWNYSNYDFTNNLFVNQTGLYNGVRQGGQTGSNFNGSQYINTSGQILNRFETNNFTVCIGYSTIGNPGVFRHLQTVYSTGNTGSYLIRMTDTNGLQFAVLNGTTAFTYTHSDDFNDGGFHLACGMRYDSTTIMLYNDAILLGNTSIPSNFNTSSSQSFLIATRNQASPSLFFTGNITSLKVWNRSLSASEISSEYVLGANSPTNNTQGLVLQYLLANSDSIYSNDSTVFNTNIAFDKQGGFENSSSTTTAFIYNATSGSITSPVGGYNSSSRFLNITWTNATFTPVNVTILNTTVSLLNDDLTNNRTISSQATGFSNVTNYDLYSQNLSVGRYWVRVQQTDANGNTVTTQNRINITTNALVNITAKRINNNVTIDSFTATITELIEGTVQTNSTTTASLVFDVIKERNYTVVITSTNYTTGNANMTINETFNQRLFYLTRFNSLYINFYDEDTFNLVVNQTIYLDLISDIYSNNYTTGNGTLLAELLAPTTYQARYSSVNYTERFYSFTIVNDTSQTLSLYLKKNTTSVLIQVKDVALNIVEGAVVKAQKLIPDNGGSYLTVEICTTDFNGECIMSLTQNDEYYRFIVLIDGDVQLTTTASYIIDDIVTLILPGQGTNADDSFEYLNIESDVSWNNASKTFSFDFSDPNNLQSNYCLDVYRNDALINRTCITSDLGSINVALVFSSNTNGTFKANGLVLITNDYLLLDQDIQYFPIAGTVANTGKLGLLIQFLLSLVFIIAVKNNPEFIPIAFGLSLIFGKAGSFTLLSWTTVSAIAFACLVISVWLGKNKN